MGPRNSVSLRNHIFQVHPELPLEQLKPVNRFQQSILDMVKAGGTLYSGRGYILK